MKQLYGERGSGKTYRLMQKANKEGAIFVCAQPLRMAEKARQEEIFGLNFMSYYDFLNLTNEDIRNKTFVSDEIELLLSVINPNIIAYSLTIGD